MRRTRRYASLKRNHFGYRGCRLRGSDAWGRRQFRLHNEVIYVIERAHVIALLTPPQNALDHNTDHNLIGIIANLTSLLAT